MNVKSQNHALIMLSAMTLLARLPVRVHQDIVGLVDPNVKVNVVFVLKQNERLVVNIFFCI